MIPNKLNISKTNPIFLSYLQKVSTLCRPDKTHSFYKVQLVEVIYLFTFVLHECLTRWCNKKSLSKNAKIFNGENERCRNSWPQIDF